MENNVVKARIARFELENMHHSNLFISSDRCKVQVFISHFSFRFERVLGPCSEILKRNIQQYNSYVSLSV